MSCRILVLLSGRGSNLEAILRAIPCRDIPARVVGVISNRPEARGLDIAREAGIATACIDHRAFAGREAFEQVLTDTIDALEPDLILLAGFMRILTPAFVTRYSPQLLNIHPSLLPAHRGLDTHARALEQGDEQHGASIHVVTPELDSGPVIARVEVPILSDDDPERLATRVQRGEHLLYPRVVDWYANGRLELEMTRVRLDGEILPATGRRYRLIEATGPAGDGAARLETMDNGAAGDEE